LNPSSSGQSELWSVGKERAPHTGKRVGMPRELDLGFEHAEAARSSGAG